MASPLASPCARRAGDVAPYHNDMFAIIWHLVFPCTLVGADVPGGPRPDGVSAGVPVCAARRGRRAYHNNMVGIMWYLVFPCIPNNMVGIMWHLVFPCTLVGADVPGGPRPRWRPDGVSAGVPVCAARRGRRALP